MLKFGGASLASGGHSAFAAKRLEIAAVVKPERGVQAPRSPDVGGFAGLGTIHALSSAICPLYDRVREATLAHPTWRTTRDSTSSLLRSKSHPNRSVHPSSTWSSQLRRQEESTMTRYRKILFFSGAFASVALVILASIEQERTFVASCTVVVSDRIGGPLEHVRVSESWNAYSYDLSGGGDARTDEQGRVSFPRRGSRHSLLFWQLRPLLTRLNYGVHASSGITAYIGTSEPGEQNTSGFTCSDRECIDQPLELKFQVKWR